MSGICVNTAEIQKHCKKKEFGLILCEKGTKNAQLSQKGTTNKEKKTKHNCFVICSFIFVLVSCLFVCLFVCLLINTIHTNRYLCFNFSSHFARGIDDKFIVIWKRQSIAQLLQAAERGRGSVL